MTREQKLAVIYAEMANKELTFGCKVKFSKWIYSIIDRENVWFLSSYNGNDWNIHNTIVIEDGVNSRCYSIEEIIWHPVRLWDVFEFLVELAEDYDYEWRQQEFDNLNLFREKKRKPIDEQSDECIRYVYSLLWTKIEKDAE